jgi:hypothetical protein
MMSEYVEINIRDNITLSYFVPNEVQTNSVFMTDRRKQWQIIYKIGIIFSNLEKKMPVIRK